MKIIICGTAYPMRGAFAQLNAMLYEHLKKEHSVKIYSFKRQYPEIFFPGKTQFEQGQETVPVPKEDNIILIDSINPFNWKSTGKKIAAENPDLVIFRYWMPFFAPCFGSIAKTIKKNSDAKILFICDNIIPHEKRFGDEMLTRLAFKHVDYFVVQSKSVEKDLQEFNLDRKPHLLTHHPLYDNYGVRQDRDNSRKFLKEKYGVNTSTTDDVILFFGYIRKYKGLDILLDAMPEVISNRNIKLIIAGEFYDDEKKYLNKLTDLNLSENIFLVKEFIPNDDVKFFFSACDLVVLPYLSATQSGIIPVAYFYDKPVVVTDVGALTEVVEDGNTGYVVKPNDEGSLAKAICKFFESGERQSIEENIVNEKKKYDWETFTTGIINFVIKNQQQL